MNKARVLDILSCRAEEFPCRYLGIPLSVFKLKRADEQALIDKVAARIPTWKGSLLNVAGRTALAKATLSAIPVHTAIALCLSPWAIEAIDKIRRGFIWAGSTSVAGGKCKVAWVTICLPKELGGLGVTDMRRASLALRARWVWRDRLEGWVPRTREHRVLALSHAATVITLGNGESVFFWTDPWLNGRSIKCLAPTVFAAVRPRKRTPVVAEATLDHAWVHHIAGAVTMQMVVEVAMLYDLLDQVQLADQLDTFSWSLTADRC